MAQVSERVRDRAKKKFVIGVLPDPVTSYERFGINFDDLAPLTDEFLVVMFSKNYATPWYWEMLTRAFKKLFKEVPLNISLYVFGPGDDPKEVATPSRTVDGLRSNGTRRRRQLPLPHRRKKPNGRLPESCSRLKLSCANASAATVNNQSKITSTWLRAGKR